MGAEGGTQFRLPFVFPMFLGLCDPYGDQSMHVPSVHMVLRKTWLDILVVLVRLAHRKLVPILIFSEIKKTMLEHFRQQYDQFQLTIHDHVSDQLDLQSKHAL